MMDLRIDDHLLIKSPDLREDHLPRDRIVEGGGAVFPVDVEALEEGRRNLILVPIPVDIHVARASLCLGIVRGRYEGRLETIFEEIRHAWAESVRGHAAGDRAMIALDVDEPLWHLSRFGCAKRDPETSRCPIRSRCELGAFCVEGKVAIERQMVSLDTVKDEEDGSSGDGGVAVQRRRCPGET